MLHDRDLCRTASKCDACRAKHNARMRAWRKTDKGNANQKAATAAWLAAHPEYERERSKRRYASDPRYRAKIRASAVRFAKEHPEYYRNAAHKRRLLEKDAGFMTAEELEARLAEFDGCVYCGRSDVPMTVDHVVPLSKGGKHERENVVAACKSCNSRKGPRPAEYMKAVA